MIQFLPLIPSSKHSTPKEVGEKVRGTSAIKIHENKNEMLSGNWHVRTEHMVGGGGFNAAHPVSISYMIYSKITLSPTYEESIHHRSGFFLIFIFNKQWENAAEYE